jgi:hypothetical protein
MSARLSVLSTEYVYVDTTVGGAEAPDLTYEAAFTPYGDGTDPTTWYPAAWDTDETAAKILVGPAGVVTLTSGEWIMWLRITSTPEIPVRQAGRLAVD